MAEQDKKPADSQSASMSLEMKHPRGHRVQVRTSARAAPAAAAAGTQSARTAAAPDE